MLAFLRVSNAVPDVTCVPNIHVVCWNLAVAGVPAVAIAFLLFAGI